MASVVCDPNGRKRIQFTDRDGERRTVRLGQASKKTANAYCEKIEKVLEAQFANTALDPEVAKWVAALGDVMHGRFVAVGLAEPRVQAAAVTLEAMLKSFFESVDVKPATLVRMKQAEAALVKHLKADCNVAHISEPDAEEWRAKLKELGYAPATISRTVLYARQMFHWAIRRGMAKANPFVALKAGPQVNPARSMFIDRDKIAKVIDAAPDAEWRLLIALSRFCGLRVPSEALALTWHDVDWENYRLTIRSPKTEHHEGRGSRIIPMFPEVREHLQAVYDAAPEGSTFVVTRYREGCNLNPQLHRIVKRAGLTAWPRLWHNLRASRQTELAASYPLHTVCAWIGNTKAIAAGHYLQVTDPDWARAVGDVGQGGAESGAQEAQNEAQQVSAPAGNDLQESQETPCLSGVSQGDANERETLHNEQVGRGGLEQPPEAAEKTCDPGIGGAESGAVPTDSAPNPKAMPPADPDLSRVIAAWPSLPEPIRRAVLALIQTTP